MFSLLISVAFVLCSSCSSIQLSLIIAHYHKNNLQRVCIFRRIKFTPCHPTQRGCVSVVAFSILIKQIHDLWTVLHSVAHALKITLNDFISMPLALLKKHNYFPLASSHFFQNISSVTSSLSMSILLLIIDVVFSSSKGKNS